MQQEKQRICRVPSTSQLLTSRYYEPYNFQDGKEEGDLLIVADGLTQGDSHNTRVRIYMYIYIHDVV
jgi:hypothetical protein